MARPITKLQDIDAAAKRLFAAHGVGRVTTKDIAREAGCAEGALYRHYSGMEEMAWTLFKRDVESFGATLKGVLHGPGTYPERVKASVSLFYNFFDQDRVTFRFILLSEHHFAIKRRVNPRLSPEHLVFSFVRKGIREGVFRIRNQELGAAMVVGLVLMPATLCATGMLKGPMRRQINDSTRACLEVLQAREPVAIKSKSRRNRAYE